ncbi:hypothetical protein ACFQ61_08565 [Streptomyces sp. NPDC056500]|uniref:hypothetical protein n=1 Tax=Streptomyces sp. NPDC056500 TaxID=3345840 RepID=UPI00367C1590
MADTDRGDSPMGHLMACAYRFPLYGDSVGGLLQTAVSRLESVSGVYDERVPVWARETARTYARRMNARAWSDGLPTLVGHLAGSWLAEFLLHQDRCQDAALRVHEPLTDLVELTWGRIITPDAPIKNRRSGKAGLVAELGRRMAGSGAELQQIGVWRPLRVMCGLGAVQRSRVEGALAAAVLPLALRHTYRERPLSGPTLEDTLKRLMDTASTQAKATA